MCTKSEFALAHVFYLLSQYAGACVHVCVFFRLWILLQYDTIFPAVIAIDLAIDGDV